jgi:hypothetical protein
MENLEFRDLPVLMGLLVPVEKEASPANAVLKDRWVHQGLAASQAFKERMGCRYVIVLFQFLVI